MKTDRKAKKVTTKRDLLIGAFAIIFAAIAAQTASARPCGALIPCPTNFAIGKGLGAPVRMIASGGTSVWALDTNFAIYRWNTDTRVFDQIPGSLVWISVGGGTLLEPDEVWGYNAAGQFYRWSSGWVAMPVPAGGLGGPVIGKGFNNSCHPYEVWALGVVSVFNGNNIWRYNYCSAAWEQVPGQLASLSVGGGEIWGLNFSGQIWRFNTTAQSGWTQIPGLLTTIAVGADGVWGVNASQQAFQFNPASQTFVQISGAVLTYVAAGGNGVWGFNASHQVFRYQAVMRTFSLSPNVVLNHISVGSGGNVWGIDTANNIRVFVTPAVPAGTIAN